MAYKPQILNPLWSYSLLSSPGCVSIACINKLFYSPVYLSFVSLIYRTPDTKHKRVEEKIFPPPHMLNKKENGRKEIYQYVNIVYAACNIFKQKKGPVKATFCKDRKLTEHQHLSCYK